MFIILYLYSIFLFIFSGYIFFNELTLFIGLFLFIFQIEN